ncbi:hypothetical protein [Hyphomicrobium sp.]|uniref:hypothetical protein n=1 Tax=Hyphomicrobium sp. TaxID=82 RepID=UPI0025C67B22|nr:hypothetical protein [Hyphomicrobium sp.]
MAAIVAMAVIRAVAEATDMATVPAFTLLTIPMTTEIATTGTTVASVAIKFTKF